MAFTFSKATDYPTSFYECKSLTLELLSMAPTLRPFSIEHIQVNFTLRVLRYRLAKYACPRAWDNDTLEFIRSFEFAFPELMISVSADDIRHKLCPCIPSAELEKNKIKIEKIAIQIKVQQDTGSLQQLTEQMTEDQSITGSDTSIDEDLESNDPESEPESPPGAIANSAIDPARAAVPMDIQFGDINIQDYDEDTDSSADSENTTCYVVSGLDPRPESQDVLEASAEQLASNTREPKFQDDPVAPVQAAWIVYHKGIDPSSNTDDITEVAVIHRKRGVAYEIRDESRRVICTFDNLPTADKLASILKPFAYSNGQIWRIFYLMRGRTPIPIRTMKALPTLAESSLLSTPMSGIEHFLL